MRAFEEEEEQHSNAKMMMTITPPNQQPKAPYTMRGLQREYTI
jgi:hypothetical protein